ncbi:MAG: thioredoxin domain-containing protein [Deltaproteobacteria bacterium]|nr:thioredoxin domain-containing protein [Deltaproteobacteria bacterium]
MPRTLAAVSLVWLLAPGASRVVLAQTPDCEALSPEKKTTAREIFSVLHPYDGCDQTFAKCLAARSPKSVVLRLASDICRQVKEGGDRKEIERNLARRAQTMLVTGPRADIVLDDAYRVGSASAPVTVVVYACARCPFCKVMVAALHDAVTDGSLAGKVRMYFRPFALKGHPGSMEGGLAFVSAAKLGRFWPYLLLVYKNYDRFCPKLLPQWAEVVGLDRMAFEREYADPNTREILVAAKQEGLRNKVHATPSIFIDGRPYVYDLTVDAVLDVLQEASEAAGR